MINNLIVNLPNDIANEIFKMVGPHPICEMFKKYYKNYNNIIDTYNGYYKNYIKEYDDYTKNNKYLNNENQISFNAYIDNQISINFMDNYDYNKKYKNNENQISFKAYIDNRRYIEIMEYYITSVYAQQIKEDKIFKCYNCLI